MIFVRGSHTTITAHSHVFGNLASGPLPSACADACVCCNVVTSLPTQHEFVAARVATRAAAHHGLLQLGEPCSQSTESRQI